MIWLNNAASSFPKPPEVYEARDRYFRMGVAGHSRSLGKGGLLAKQLASRCRALLAELFEAKEEQVFFTSGATEALNIVFANTPKGAPVVSTQSRHNAVRRTAAAYGLSETLLPPLTEENYKPLLDKSLKPGALLVLNACSNVNGHCEPVEHICAHVRQNFPEVRIAVDGAQAAGHLPLSLSWGMDYLALTAHKGLYGPAGLGALICPLPIRPLIFGGTGEHSRRLEQGVEDGMFESGTRDGASLGAWAEGLAFVQKTGIAALGARENALKTQFLGGLEGLPLRVFAEGGPLVSLTCKGFRSEELAAFFESEDIIIRGGLHCAPDMHDFLGTGGAARFSFGWFNTPAEIRKALDVLREIFKGAQ